METTTDRSALEGKLIPELQRIAQEMGIEGTQKLRKAGLIDAIVAKGGNGGQESAGNGEAAARSPRTPRRQRGAGVGRHHGDRARGRHVGGPRRDREATSSERSTGIDEERGDRGDERGEDAATATTAASRGARPRPRAQPRPGPEPRSGPRARSRSRPGPEPRPGPQPDQDRGQDRNRDQEQNRDGGRDRDGRRQRPSREERRRQREERRVREEQERAEEIANAPTVSGILDLLPDGYGFLRTSGYTPGPEDVYVSLSQVRKMSLRKGDVLEGKVRRPRDNEKYAALLEVDSVNGMDPEAAKERANFEKLTPLFPDDRFRLENGPVAVSERIIDMIAPIGKGQRGMVVSPPKAGKTTILKQIANGILHSNPEVHLIVLLVDERPEEVTDWQRTVTAAEVVYSTFDKPTDQHVQVTELVLERAKRLAEQKQDVVIILDSLTRLARAYNLAMPTSGKILTGGIDSAALYPPRRFFGAARNIEEGGSFTIIASALVETGSRMDDGIFEEFKGTGNMELRLDRSLAEKRLFPAINVDASGTRKEELLMGPEELALVIKLRRVLHALEPAAALELLTDKIRATKSNEQFLKEIAKAPSGG